MGDIGQRNLHRQHLSFQQQLELQFQNTINGGTLLLEDNGQAVATILNMMCLLDLTAALIQTVRLFPIY